MILGHALVRGSFARGPHRSAVESLEARLARDHVREAAQPDETVRTLGTTELTETGHAAFLLRLDEFGLEVSQELIVGPG